MNYKKTVQLGNFSQIFKGLPKISATNSTCQMVQWTNIKSWLDGNTLETQISGMAQKNYNNVFPFMKKGDIIISVFTGEVLYVDMEVKATSVFGIESIKYAFDCESSCQYKDVVNNHITVSNTGTTKVVIEVQDKSNQKAIKTIDVKIDKEAPKAEVGKTTYEGKGEVSVCATCKDSQSGCKQSKVCKKYTSSKSNQTITVEDNAGNKGESSAFNVKVAELKEPCYLTVSDTGLVKATLREEASYYGFNSSYSGENQKSMQISINASKKGESGAKVVTYYVKNKNGSGGMCYATVIKECDCTDPSSTAANCPVTCKYSIR